ncbi:MAG TPA: zinc-binding dehydrogenase [Candidatus Limnocylindrales bacterium]|nr:zinc-binding dehydrogenase [Candidatus Limnocylindrales bacterium]
MRAVVLRSGKLIVDDVMEPEPGPGMALVRTLACGICGSDLHAARHLERMASTQKRAGSPFALDPSRDIVMGHEFCAEILDYGAGSSQPLPVGTTVCAMPIAIGASGLQTIGYSNDLPGGYAERMLLTEMLLLPVPNGLPAHRAALTEPMAVGVHAVAKANLQPDDVALVLGCGPIGLAVIAALELAGASPVVAADFSPARRALAQKMGADVVVDPAVESPYQRWEDLANPEKVDPHSPLTLMGLGPQLRPGVVFECVGVPGVLAQILAGAMRQTRVVVVGVCMESDTIEPIFGIQKELSLQFVLGYTPEEFASTLGHIADGRIDVTPLVTGRVGLEEVPRAFEELAHPDRHAKIIVEP